jgi:PKD repeat protein
MDMAWDPSGQYGYIMGFSDFTIDAYRNFDLFYYKTSDFGQTWNGPVVLPIDSLSGKVASPINQNEPFTYNGEGSVVVDTFGNPHFFVLANPNSEDNFPIFQGTTWEEDTYLYHLRIDTPRNQCSEWAAIPIAPYNTEFGIIRGTPPNTVVQASHTHAIRTERGNKIFFSWTDSDPNVVSNNQNVAPDMKMIAYDVVNDAYTDIKDWTTNDPQFSGRAYWPSQSIIAYPTDAADTAWNIPTVIGDMDDLAPFNGLIEFYYIRNIDFNSSDFGIGGDQIGPEITLIGSADTIIQRASNWNDPGANAFDCTDNSGNVAITIDNSNFDVNTVGEYTIMYIATDQAGNADTTYREVEVSDVPSADFTSNTNFINGEVRFTNTSTPQNTSGEPLITSWLWLFGDGNLASGPNDKNSTINVYDANGSYDVTLRVTTPFGQDEVTKTINVTSVGTSSIPDVEFSEQLSVYPNPANESIRIEGLVKSESHSVKIVDILGQTLLETENINNTISHTLDISQLANGSYFILVSTQDKTGVKALSIQR